MILHDSLNSGSVSEQKIGAPVSQSNDLRYYSGIDWGDIVFHLLENIHWILLTALLGAILFGAYAKFVVTPIYQTTSKIYIAGSETTISLSDIQLGTSLAKDYQEVFKIWHVHEMVDERLGLDYSYSKLSSMVSVSNPDGSHLLYIRVSSSDPEEAKLLADTYAEVVQEFIAEKMELRKPQLLEVAQIPSRPVSPNIGRDTVKGFAIGGMLAAVILVFLYIIDDRIRTGEDVEKATGLVTLGILEKQEGLSAESDQESEITVPAEPEKCHAAVIGKSLSLDYSGNESINAICSGILFAGKNLKRIAVTSHDSNNGKTFIALRIAYSMAKRGKKVLLVDCDFRKSVMRAQYRIEHTDSGLAHYLSGQSGLDSVIYKTNQPNMDLLPVGEIIRNPLPLLTSDDFGNLLAECAEQYDLVIIDTPPIGAVIDAAEIAKHCDGSLLVIEYNTLSRNELRYMQRIMEQSKTPVIGCIINRVAVRGPFRRQYYYRYSGSYDYYYGEESKTERHRSGRSSEKGTGKK